MSEQKTAPAMFEGARVPKDPPPAATAKPTDRASALKSTGGGVPAGRLTGLALLPVVAVGLIALAAWSPMAALIAGGALMVMVLIGMVSRSAGKRRVATRTSVRPDGTVTTTTKPISRREHNRRQRTRNGPPWRRPRGDSRSPNSRSRSWIPRSDRRNNRRSAVRSGPGSPGGRGTPGGRPDGTNPDRPSARQRLRDRMRPNRRDRNAAGHPTGPGGRPAPGGPKNPHSPGSPNSRNRDSRWPWSRNRNNGDSPGGKTPSGSPGSPNGRRPKNNAGSPGSPGGGGGWRPWRSKANDGGNPGGRPKGKTPRNVKNTAPSSPNGGKPSKVPNWVKRVVAPSDPPIPRDRSNGMTSRLKDRARDKWRSAWSDNTPVIKPRQRTERGDKPEPSRRSWWPARRSDSAAASSTAAAPTGNSEGRYRRLMNRLNRPAKVPRVDHAARLDEVWKARGIGQRIAPKADPVVRPKPSASSAESAAFAEDWMPTPQSPMRSRHSAEAGVMAEGDDWTPSKPSRPAPRPASKGENKMSSQGGIPQGADASTATSRAAAYSGAANAASRVSAAKANLANTQASQANALSGREGMEAAAGNLRAESAKSSQDSATMGAIAGKLREWGAAAANVVRR